ncbi:hypothetical protein FHS57_004754 [Runella defluvii]|uniref:Uncharacterized protein n=1 Tax=Runella defluvii TaxID=370973 RepID=A0A7W6ESI0_9BACT|nr:hypothetical protein [Runella defluvii]MBB3840734.1 hypothetical protein [Runella defluvii]
MRKHAFSFNETSMPFAWGMGITDFDIGDYLGVQLDNKNTLCTADHMSAECFVVQILSIEKGLGRTLFLTDLGLIPVSNLKNGQLCKVDMSRHLFSPPIKIALSKLLEKYRANEGF